MATGFHSDSRSPHPKKPIIFSPLGRNEANTIIVSCARFGLRDIGRRGNENVSPLAASPRRVVLGDEPAFFGSVAVTVTLQAVVVAFVGFCVPYCKRWGKRRSRRR